MTKIKTRASALILAAIMLIASIGLTSCKEESTDTVAMKYGNSVITDGMLTYWLASYKGIFSKSFENYSNTPEFWDSDAGNGKTMEEYLFETALTKVKMTLVCMKLFEDHKLSISSSVLKNYDNYIADLITDGYDGKEEMFNIQLNKFGIDKSTLKDIYCHEEKVEILFDYYYGKNGTTPLTKGELDAYYNGTYARFLHIYVNNKYEYKVDENGVNVTDDKGQYVTVGISPEKKAEKDAVIEKIDAALEADEAFDEVYAKYSEDKIYGNGYYVTITTEMVDEVMEAVWTSEVGEWKKVESDYGTHYVLRMELDDAGYDDPENIDFFEEFTDEVKQYYFNKKIMSYIGEIQVNQEIIDTYSMRNSYTNLVF